MNAEHNKKIIQDYFDALRKDKSPATLDKYIAEDNLKQHIAQTEPAFPGYWIETEEMLAEGDKVVVRGTLRGVHKGAFNGIPPTGKEIAVAMFITYQLINGKITNHWMLLDQMGMMQQLGLMPIPA
jgi:predicted ester cyclase